MSGSVRDPRPLKDFMIDGWIHHIDPQTGKPERGDGWQRLGTFLIASNLYGSGGSNAQRWDTLFSLSQYFVTAVGRTKLTGYPPQGKLGRPQLVRAPTLSTPPFATNDIDDWYQYADWWNLECTMSEDNWIPMMIAGGFLVDFCYDDVKEQALTLLKRWGFSGTIKPSGLGLSTKRSLTLPSLIHGVL
jgi:hypothetical protein